MSLPQMEIKPFTYESRIATLDRANASLKSNLMRKRKLIAKHRNTISVQHEIIGNLRADIMERETMLETLRKTVMEQARNSAKLF